MQQPTPQITPQEKCLMLGHIDAFGLYPLPSNHCVRCGKLVIS